MGKKVAYLGFFTALAIILGYVDAMIPVFVTVPGVKLGLANLAMVFVLYTYGLRAAGAVSFVRILAVGFLFGNMFSILYSLAGAVLSLLAMGLLRKHLSFISVSMMGGVAHNVGQLLVAMAVVESLGLMVYFPVLLIAGAVTGLCIGIAAREVWKRVGRKIE